MSQSLETLENHQETYATLIASAKEQLVTSGIATERVEHVLQLFKGALQEQNVIDEIVENISTTVAFKGRKVTPQETESAVKGLLFEAVALNNLPEHKTEYAELERFLLLSLKDPRVWFTDFWPGYENWESPQDAELYKEYLKVRPTPDELNALRNNDAIRVNVERDPNGSLTAIITGVVEAKTYTPKPGSRSEQQALEAPKALYDTVKRYREIFPLLARYLDLAGPGFPTHIDILEPEQLGYIIVQPNNMRDLNMKKPPQGIFANAEYEYVDISHNELDLLTKVLLPEIQSRIKVGGQRV